MDIYRLSYETGAPVSRCTYALSHYKDYDKAREYLIRTTDVYDFTKSDSD